MLDWIAREGGLVLSWWLLVTLAGAAALPLCARLLGGLPDRGYTLARAAGLLLVGFAYWLLGSLGFLRNTPGNIALAWLLVLGVSLAVGARGVSRPSLAAWWRRDRHVVIAAEVLFALAFLGWALFRAHENGLTGTEKPMDLMMLSGIARSPAFPPNDAWLSGYAISYYYFGYLLAAMLTMLSGAATTVGYNLTTALLFALTALGAFGVAYNLARSRAADAPGRGAGAPGRRAAILTGLAGALLVALMGNYHLPLVEIPYQTGGASADSLRFWSMPQRQTPQAIPSPGATALDPATWGGGSFWWWFRSARVLGDLDLNGGHMEVIDEFPAFSFLLADNHPHVSALPFALLAAGLALNLLLLRRPPAWAEIAFYGLVLGGVAFLNTWDAPVYLLLLLGAEAARRLLRSDGARLTRGDLLALLRLGGLMLGIAVLAYLPFWLSFRSQAGGVLPNLLNPTRTPQLFLMFGPFFVLVPLLLAVESWRARGRMRWRLGLLVGVGVLALLLLALLVFTGLGLLVPSLRGEAIQAVDAAGGLSVVLPQLLGRRVETILTVVLLLVGLIAVVARLFARPGRDDRPMRDTVGGERDAPATLFALLMLGLAFLLVLAPEFVYLRDNFGSRMNTIFKFYYQAWVLMALAGAYGLFSLFADARVERPSPALRAAAGGVAAVALTLGALFPVMGMYTRALVENGRLGATPARPLTLDGAATFASPDDYDAILCLDALVGDGEAVVAEAVGPAYRNEYGRVAALTGIPIVLGWENHEAQWRGSTYGAAVGTRAQDLARLYQDPRWELAEPILAQYGIDYVFFGSSERSAYGTGGEDKFREHAAPVCERGGSVFYRVSTDGAVR